MILCLYVYLCAAHAYARGMVSLAQFEQEYNYLRLATVRTLGILQVFTLSLSLYLAPACRCQVLAHVAQLPEEPALALLKKIQEAQVRREEESRREKERRRQRELEREKLRYASHIRSTCRGRLHNAPQRAAQSEHEFSQSAGRVRVPVTSNTHTHTLSLSLSLSFQTLHVCYVSVLLTSTGNENLQRPAN
jgi:hypothetical protein